MLLTVNNINSQLRKLVVYVNSLSRKLALSQNKAM